MNFIKKWYTYQKERFPILTMGTYILCIAIAVFFYANSFQIGNIKYIQILPMFVVAFLQFLMVRIIDEFKDYEEDCKYRPYRPVPRGLITLKELRVLFIISIIMQLAVTIICSRDQIAPAIISLTVLWVFFALMTKGYFIKKYLEKHIVVEVLLDEIMMPIMMVYMSTLTRMPELIKLIPIMFLGYFASCVIEVARKVRCKKDEEKGVKTYTAVLGIPKAILLLQAFETGYFASQLYIANKAQKPALIITQIILYVLLSICNILFVKTKTKKCAKFVELIANALVIVTYLSMIFI